jgi:His-Xaa-Ser system radical SAM maturase HxsC
VKTAAPLHTHASVKGVEGVRLVKVLTPEEAVTGAYAFGDVLVCKTPAEAPFAGSFGCPSETGISVQDVRDANVVQPGDVLRLREGSGLVSVLFRRGANANTLLVTERCNSLCVMCSQPPNPADDSWRLGELRHLIDLVDLDEAHLGFSGGEPTLLEEDFADLLRHARRRLPRTRLHVLTNGRGFADPKLAYGMTLAGGKQTTWAVPLYADVADLHDEIVAAPGAFDETIRGLGHLAEQSARVEIRVVLHALSTPRLPQLAAYISRRLPFVDHVALMGLEPMGFARRNRSKLWIDPADYAAVLSAAAHHLDLHGIPVSLYNLPYCSLPANLWPLARSSISDWKNIPDPSCGDCAAREVCSGLFRSAGPEWRSRTIRSLSHEEFTRGLA